jgi:DNA-binding transcriptional regulator LsrR (DeoR family)
MSDSARASTGASTSPPPAEMGPSELIRALAVARLYYVDGRSKLDIAKDFGISRFKVARILDACLAQGLVSVEIHAPTTIEVELSELLRRRFDLRQAVVVRVLDPAPAPLREALGEVASRLLTELVTESDVLGVGWGRTINATVRHLRTLAPCRVVQLTGVVGEPGLNAVDVVTSIAGRSGGPVFPLYAPMVVSDADTARALRNDPAVRETVQQYDSVTVAAVSIGSWNPTDSILHDGVSPRERTRLRLAGVQSEVCAVLFGPDGTVVAPDFSERCLSVTAEQLAAIPNVVAIAGGVHKTAAIGAVLSSGLVDTLVTDSAVARELVGETASSGTPRG